MSTVNASGFVKKIVQNCGMAKKGFKPNIDPAAYIWMRTEMNEQSCTKSVIITAALMALRAVNPEERTTHVHWANALNDGHVKWAEFEAIAGAKRKARDKALLELAARAIEREIAKEGEVRREPA